MLNLFVVWLALWIFLSDDYRNRPMPIISLYILGAIAAFCKGLVGPAVIFTSIGFCSTVELFMDLKRKDFAMNLFVEYAFHRFRWVLSWPGMLGIFAGCALFIGLLLAPVVSTGSWQSVNLMWKENVLRFFLPFDHIEPPYIYLKYIPLFFAPWTLLLIASLLEIKKLLQVGSSRWIVLVSACDLYILYSFRLTEKLLHTAYIAGFGYHHR